MRRVVALLACGVLLLGTAVVVVRAPRASAATSVTCQKIDTRTGLCLVKAASGNTSTTAPSVRPAASGASSAAQSCYSDWTDQTVACTSEEGSWSNSRDCYVAPLQPPPPADSPEWQGHSGGAFYTCIPDATRVGTELTYFFWAATAPDAPDPAELARQAVAAMGLRAIRIGMVPDPTPDSIGLVGMPTWMWVQQPSAATWGPTTRTASAGGVTVTATAQVDHVTWTMGDGSTVVCTSAGTAYEDRYADEDSPDCGHRYAQTSVGQPGNAYAVTATSHWVITWTGGGANGQFEQDLTAQTTVRIGEMQVLVTG